MVEANSHLQMVVNADGAVILDIKRGKISTLNPTGAFVWQALERGEDLEAIATRLANETGKQVEVLERDLLEFIDALKKAKLLPY